MVIMAKKKKKVKKKKVAVEGSVVVQETQASDFSTFSKYQGKVSDEKVYSLSLLGLNDKDLALCFDITPHTFIAWREKYPSFAEALKHGREVSDAQVAAALFQRAVGFHQSVVDVRAVGGEIVKTRYKKYFPPNVAAGMYWLNNRQGGQWGNKKTIDVTANINTTVTSIDVSDFSLEELMVAKKLGLSLEKQRKQMEANVIDAEGYDYQDGIEERIGNRVNSYLSKDDFELDEEATFGSDEEEMDDVE